MAVSKEKTTRFSDKHWNVMTASCTALRLHYTALSCPQSNYHHCVRLKSCYFSLRPSLNLSTSRASMPLRRELQFRRTLFSITTLSQNSKCPLLPSTSSFLVPLIHELIKIMATGRDASTILVSAGQNKTNSNYWNSEHIMNYASKTCYFLTEPQHRESWRNS